MKRAANGFTLIEILIVIVIVGVTLTLASVNLFRDDGQVLNEEAKRLAALLSHAQTEAMITGNAIAWSAQQGKYEFWRRGKNGKWDEPSSDEILRARTFPAEIEWGEIRVAGNAIKLDERLIFLAGGLNQPFELKLKYRDKHLTILGDPTGRVVVDDKA